MAKTCKTCNYCKTLYRRYYLYYREKKYFCIYRNEMTLLSESCQKWCKKARNEYDLTPERFDEVQKDIVKMIELLKDN